MREDHQVYLFLFIGSLCIFAAILFGGNADKDVFGSTEASFYGTLFLSLTLVLIGGIFWVSAAKLLRPARHTQTEILKPSRTEETKREHLYHSKESSYYKSRHRTEF